MFNSIKMSHKHQKFTVTAIVALFYSLFCFVRFVDVPCELSIQRGKIGQARLKQSDASAFRNLQLHQSCGSVRKPDFAQDAPRQHALFEQLLQLQPNGVSPVLPTD
jgi:hypothetical protein